MDPYAHYSIAVARNLVYRVRRPAFANVRVVLRFQSMALQASISGPGPERQTPISVTVKSDKQIYALRHGSGRKRSNR